ncbi:MAG: hypothetical protein HON47_01660 [Candidatus Diapherotrites archaeon]|jgi:hypothetical protein|uniref:Uncharacterized protein n=1 Tax=Candidatus Iainarchaeum sp. TaxID=3101447 RepID=A0A8T5GE74_9ARCH|nr:hypothetical protein [Candidatus Diapherotrites archaeon]MBT7366666.1 hypothetical protein [Candidatus Woesearchaeota archaeon]
MSPGRRTYKEPVNIELTTKIHLMAEVQRTKGFETKRFRITLGKHNEDRLIKIGTKATQDRIVFAVTPGGMRCVKWPNMKPNSPPSLEISQLQIRLESILKDKKILK